MIDLYDVSYVYGGEELTHKFIDETPSSLFSIAEWGTVGVIGSISPKDMDAIAYDEYVKIDDCREEHTNPRITFRGKCTEDPYCRMHEYHNKDSIDFFKKYVKNNIKDYLKRLKIDKN